MASLLLGGIKALIFRLVFLAAILLLAYFFLIKPLTDEARDSASGVQGVVDTVTEAIDTTGVGSAVDRVRSELAGSGLAEDDARRLVACMRRAGEDRAHRRRCARRFGP